MFCHVCLDITRSLYFLECGVMQRTDNVCLFFKSVFIFKSEIGIHPCRIVVHNLVLVCGGSLFHHSVVNANVPHGPLDA